MEYRKTRGLPAGALWLWCVNVQSGRWHCCCLGRWGAQNHLLCSYCLQVQMCGEGG